jgi:hypothetical protein
LRLGKGASPSRVFGSAGALPSRNGKFGCSGEQPFNFEPSWQPPITWRIPNYIPHNWVTEDAILILICPWSAWVAPPIVFSMDFLAGVVLQPDTVSFNVVVVDIGRPYIISFIRHKDADIVGSEVVRITNSSSCLR